MNSRRLVSRHNLPLRAAAVSSLALGLLIAACARDSNSQAEAPAAQPVPTTAQAAAVPATPVAAGSLRSPSVQDPKPSEFPGLHNVVAFHPGYFSGAVPEGEPGFDSLKTLGIRTIISVDGAEPDVAAAKARGIRYIHLPIGYNGFSEQRKLELVRASRDALAEGPVYIHCHHGKHRSAGAAATVAASLGWSTPGAMINRMKVSGTAPSYKGLYACAESSTVLASETIDAVPAAFPEVSRPAGFVKLMVEIDEIMEHLKAIDKAGWKPPSDHPDLVPAAEAGRLADLLRHSFEDARTRREDARHAGGFGAAIKDNARLASELEAAIVAVEAPSELAKRFRAVNASCTSCHQKYRD